MIDNALMYRRSIKRCNMVDEVVNVFVPLPLQDDAIRFAHSLPWAGHMAKDRTRLKTAKMFFFSKNGFKDWSFYFKLQFVPTS